MPHCFCSGDFLKKNLLPLTYCCLGCGLHTFPSREKTRLGAWRKMSCEVVQNTQPWYPADVKLDIPGRGERKQKTPMNHLLHEGPLAAPALCKHPEQPGTLLIFLGHAVFSGIGSSKLAVQCIQCSHR